MADLLGLASRSRLACSDQMPNGRPPSKLSTESVPDAIERPRTEPRPKKRTLRSSLATPRPNTNSMPVGGPVVENRRSHGEAWDPKIGTVPVLGRGAYGMVYSLGGGQCAKVARFSADNFYREAFFLSLLACHPGVVDLYGIQSDGRGRRILILEECACTMQQWMTTGPSTNNKVQVLVDIIGSLELLHRMNVVHADIKPENIMFTESGNLKIIDFGLSTFRELATTKYTTPRYRGSKPGFRQDVYAAAIAIRQMFGFRGKETTRIMSQYIPPPAAEVIESLGKKKNHGDLRNYLTHLDRQPLDIEAFTETASLGLEASVLDEFDLDDIEYPRFFRTFLDHNPDQVENILCTVSLLHWKPKPRKFLGLNVGRGGRTIESSRALNCRCSAGFFDFFKTFILYVREYSYNPRCEVPKIVEVRRNSRTKTHRRSRPGRYRRSRSTCEFSPTREGLSTTRSGRALSLSITK